MGVFLSLLAVSILLFNKTCYPAVLRYMRPFFYTDPCIGAIDSKTVVTLLVCPVIPGEPKGRGWAIANCSGYLPSGKRLIILGGGTSRFVYMSPGD